MQMQLESAGQLEEKGVSKLLLVLPLLGLGASSAIHQEHTQTAFQSRTNVLTMVANPKHQETSTIQ